MPGTDQRLWPRRHLLAAAAVGLVAGKTVIAAPHARTSILSRNAYEKLLLTWCDGLVARQARGHADPAIDGGFLCPGCGLVHGRSADAIYPLLCAARLTGRRDYVAAARAAYDWSERAVSRADGSWVNEPVLSDWKGITVFRCVTLCESLLRHGELLDAPTRRAWRDRLARAYAFLEGFITFDTGNINYPVASAYAFSLGSEVLGRADYADRARQLAHGALDYVTDNGLLFGEGHPQRGTTPKRRRAVDLGYNVEESLPALALYGLRAADETVIARTVAMMQAHIEFMLPDGAWDNSWGSRNYKWSWWGSRTSDGCQSAYRLMAARDPRFAEVADRNLALMARCTRDGLLQGGPDYAAAGYAPCIHHTFSHAKALATVIDAGAAAPSAARSLPRDRPYGLKSFPEVGTHLASVGDWRATVTDYDWDYLAPAGGGHASGGALSLLYHQAFGPVLVASLTKYKVVEVGNQQVPIGPSHQVLTPRIEAVDDDAVSSLNDFGTVVQASGDTSGVRFHAEGALQAIDHTASGGRYALSYDIGGYDIGNAVDITAAVTGRGGRLVLPLIARPDDVVTQAAPGTIVLTRSGRRLTVTTDAPGGFAPLLADRIFNLVPGFQAARLNLPLVDGQPVHVRFAIA